MFKCLHFLNDHFSMQRILRGTHFSLEIFYSESMDGKFHKLYELIMRIIFVGITELRTYFTGVGARDAIASKNALV